VPPLTAELIKAQATRLGFDLCGICRPEAYPELGFLEEWLRRGYAGDMSYLGRTRRVRSDVRHVLPSAQSVIVTATNYNAPRPYATAIEDSGVARIARYAWGDDYHEVILQRLNALWLWMRATHPEPFEAAVYVDTGPIQERVYAQHAGIGWIGKHTCVISAKRGSWIFLSTILCSLPLEADPPATDHCGTCTKCLEACPTGAIVEPYVLDARRCLSYLTIEQKKAIPEAHAAAAGAWIYGCDICQDVCPWNQAPLVSDAATWMPRPALDAPRLVDLWRTSDADLEAALAGSAMTRAPVPQLRRNLANALGNATDAESRAALDDAPDADRPSLAESVVQAAMAQARRRIVPTP
jgi:epoxyqueuosine reductase